MVQLLRRLAKCVFHSVLGVRLYMSWVERATGCYQSRCYQRQVAPYCSQCRVYVENTFRVSWMMPIDCTAGCLCIISLWADVRYDLLTDNIHGSTSNKVTHLAHDAVVSGPV